MKKESCDLPKQFVREEAAEGHASMKKIATKNDIPITTKRPRGRPAGRARGR